MSLNVNIYEEELRINLLLPSTESVTKLLEERKKKREEIWQDFYATDAMPNRNWTKAKVCLLVCPYVSRKTIYIVAQQYI
jgi:hypothetical protein